MVALAERSCTPCRGGVSPLTPRECASYLAEVPDWELRDEGRTVARRFRFPDYRTALAFANAVSVLAEETFSDEKAAIAKAAEVWQIICAGRWRSAERRM